MKRPGPLVNGQWGVLFERQDEGNWYREYASRMMYEHAGL
jgi:hypothetical protein